MSVPCDKCNKPVNFGVIHVDIMIYEPKKGWGGLSGGGTFCKECGEKAAQLLEDWVNEDKEMPRG